MPRSHSTTPTHRYFKKFIPRIPTNMPVKPPPPFLSPVELPRPEPAARSITTPPGTHLPAALPSETAARSGGQPVPAGNQLRDSGRLSATAASSFSSLGAAVPSSGASSPVRSAQRSSKDASRDPALCPEPLLLSLNSHEDQRH